MIAYIITNTILSIITVILIHYLWEYLKDTYTTKRTKDVVGYQTQKYRDIMDELLASSTSPTQSVIEEPEYQENAIDFLSPEYRARMVQELKDLATFDDI
jgi:uncharacterized membrane protein YdfJ with MMPL/SSD domain